jgi:hypothetical protein
VKVFGGRSWHDFKLEGDLCRSTDKNMAHEEPANQVLQQKEDDDDSRYTNQQQSHRFELGRSIAQLRKTDGRVDANLTDGRLGAEKAHPRRCPNRC